MAIEAEEQLTMFLLHNQTLRLSPPSCSVLAGWPRNQSGITSGSSGSASLRIAAESDWLPEALGLAAADWRASDHALCALSQKAIEAANMRANLRTPSSLVQVHKVWQVACPPQRAQQLNLISARISMFKIGAQQYGRIGRRLLSAMRRT